MSDRRADSLTREDRMELRTRPANSRSSSFVYATEGIRLSAVRNNLSWSHIDLPPGTYTLGSGPDCDIVLDVEGVAARHCTLIVGTQRTIAKSWTNRTWLNEGALTEGTLKPGDRLCLGPIELKISTPAPGARSISASSVLPVEESVREELSEQDLQSLLTLAESSSQPNVHVDSPEKYNPHDETRLQDLKQEIEECLREVLRREHATREEFTRERMALSHRSQELHQQWQQLEIARRRLQQDQESSAEGIRLSGDLRQKQQAVSAWEQQLEMRHDELAGRARQLVSVHRQLKTRQQNVSKPVEAPLIPVSHDHEQISSLRSMAARNEAQSRQLTQRQKECEQREESLLQQREEISAGRIQLMEETRQLEEEQRQWQNRSRSRERILNDLDESLSARMREIEEEELRQTEEKTRFAQQQAEFQTRSQEFQRRLQAAEQAAESLSHQQQLLTEEQARITEWQEQLQAQTAELKEKADHLQSQQAAFHEQEKSWTLERGQFEAEKEKLQHELGEVAAERLNFARLRSELDAERERDAYDRHQLQQGREQLEHLQEGLERQRQELATARSELQQQRQAFEFQTAAMLEKQNSTDTETDALRQSLDAEKRDLESQWEQFHSGQQNLMEERDLLERRQHQIETAQHQLQLEQAELESLRAEIDEARQHLAAREQELEDNRHQLRLDRDNLSIPSPEEPEQYRSEPSSSFTSISAEAEMPPEQEKPLDTIEPSRELATGDEGESSPSSTHEENATLQLRQQLADLFGMKPASESSVPELSVPLSKPKEDQPKEQQPVPESPYGNSPASVQKSEEIASSPLTKEAELTSPSSGDHDGEESIAVYMERLLARNRRESAFPEPVEPVSPAPVSSLRPSVPVEDPSVDIVELQSQPVPRKQRKIDEDEKKSIRNNLHSFRELANHSARTAVAKSRRTQKSSSLRNMVILNVLGWGSAMAMLIGEQWLVFSLRIEAFCVSIVSLCLTGLCLYRYKEIRKLNLRAAPGNEKKPASSSGNHPADSDATPEKSGPLSFL